jgi:DNA-binding XRE family transcriptional regulator
MDKAVRRRVRAGRMLLAGKTPAQAALAVGVARQTVYESGQKCGRLSSV